MKNTKEQKKLNLNYYRSVIFQFLGFERDIYENNNGSYTIYHYQFGKMYIFPKANKIKFAHSRKWVSDADIFLRTKVIKDKSCPSYDEFYQKTLF